MPDSNKIKLERHSSEPSPKVAVPAAVTLAVAVVWSIILGDIDPEQIALAVASLGHFILGYLKKDSIDYGDAVEAVNAAEPA